MITSSIPAWARDTLTRLMENRWEGERPEPISEQGERQLRTTEYVADTYTRYDEKPAHDKAMDLPGVVLTGSTKMTFEGQENAPLRAVLEGSDKEGRPVVVYLERDHDRLEAYSMQNLGEVAYLQGGRADQPEQEGFYLSHAVALPTAPSGRSASAPSA